MPAMFPGALPSYNLFQRAPVHTFGYRPPEIVCYTSSIEQLEMELRKAIYKKNTLKAQALSNQLTSLNIRLGTLLFLIKDDKSYCIQKYDKILRTLVIFDIEPETLEKQLSFHQYPEFYCPISLEFMTCPVILGSLTATGHPSHTFDLKNIRKVLNAKTVMNPLTNEIVKEPALTINLDLVDKILDAINTISLKKALRI